ncbi:hypothetical protein [Coleofasciculus sp. G3-WIS-01]|uniref:hypothetical protein n=1 Tax=Coleofasciculus sp. G3-WIS-01 TaxID=3069528 RepID=UPI00406358E3
MSGTAQNVQVGWVEERNPTGSPWSWVSFLNPTYKGDMLPDELLTCIYQRSPATRKTMLTRQADWAGVVMGLTR